MRCSGSVGVLRKICRAYQGCFEWYVHKLVTKSSKRHREGTVYLPSPQTARECPADLSAAHRHVCCVPPSTQRFSRPCSCFLEGTQLKPDAVTSYGVHHIHASGGPVQRCRVPGAARLVEPSGRAYSPSLASTVSCNHHLTPVQSTPVTSVQCTSAKHAEEVEPYSPESVHMLY